MKIKGFFSFYGVYLQIVLAAVAVVATIVDRDVFIENWPISAAIACVVFLLPFLVLGIASAKGAFAKWLRLVILSLFKVETFAGVGLIILFVFSFLFLFNIVLRNTYMGEQIFLNVFLLNILFVFFLALVLGG